MITMSNIGCKQKPFKRKAITLEEKLEVIRRYENSERTCDISRVTGFNEATLRSIRSNAENIKKCYADSTPVGAKRSIKVRPKAMQKMEKHLMDWIKDEIPKNPNISQLDIKINALKIFENVKKDFPNEINLNFTASNGWFHRFKVRHQLQNVRFNGDGSLSIQSVSQNSPGERIYHDHFEENCVLTSENSILKTCLLSDVEACDKNESKNVIENTNEADLYDTPLTNVLKNLCQIEEALSNLQKLDNNVQNSSVIIKEVKLILKPYYDLLQPNIKTENDLSQEINSSTELNTLCQTNLVSDTKRLKKSFDLEDTCEMILPI